MTLQQTPKDNKASLLIRGLVDKVQYFFDSKKLWSTGTSKKSLYVYRVRERVRQKSTGYFWYLNLIYGYVSGTTSVGHEYFYGTAGVNLLFYKIE